MTLPLQNIKDAARQVDPGVIPDAEEGAGQIVDGVDDGGGIGEDPLFDADHFLPGRDRQIPRQLLPGTHRVDLDAVCMGIAAEAADQGVIFQFLIQPAAQTQHRAVDHRADAAHPLDVTGTLHLAQRVADHRPAHAQLSRKIDLGRQAVGLRIAAGAQFVQQRSHDAVADDGTAQPTGRGKSGIFHRMYPPVHGRADPAWTSGSQPPGAKVRLLGFLPSVYHKSTGLKTAFVPVLQRKV